MFTSRIKDHHVTSRDIPSLLLLWIWGRASGSCELDGDKLVQLVLKDAIKELFLSNCEPSFCLCAGEKRTITPHIYRAQTDVQPKLLTQSFARQSPFIHLFVGENVRCTWAFWKGTWGSSFFHKWVGWTKCLRISQYLCHKACLSLANRVKEAQSNGPLSLWHSIKA